MEHFIVSVDLRDATYNTDYTRLHHEMEKYGFSRTSSSSVDETVYHLPTAKYNAYEDYTVAEVLKTARKAVAKMGKKFSVLVTKANGVIWNWQDMLGPAEV